MKKKSICWITSNYFIDVDIPIIPNLCNYYDIEWRILHNKKAKNDYIASVNELAQRNNIKCHFHYLRNRRRNIRIIGEYWKILIKLKKKKYDLFYINDDGWPYLFFLVLIMLNRNKLIWAVHHVTIPKGAVDYSFNKLYMIIFLKIYKNYQVFSRYQLAEMQKKCPRKNVFFAPLALISFGKSESRLPEDQLVFLFFGYIRDYKGLDILINAANRVYDKIGNKFKIKIFGYCSDWGKYEKLIKYPEIFELKIESIQNEEIPRLFNESHYVVMPYRDLAQSAVLTVAFNYNVPVIASDITSFKEFIINGDNGFLFERGSVESLAAVMMKLINAEKISYIQIKKNQSEYVEKYLSTESITKSYVDYFESLGK